MNVIIELENASGDKAVPDAEQFRRWAMAALGSQEDAQEPAETDYILSIRLVDEKESAGLNSQYRDKPGATNILSFPLGDFPVLPEAARPLGDLAICTSVVRREAQQQNKSETAHWAHLTVHGILHLNGYDHITDKEAKTMEALEVNILANLGFADPYDFTTLASDTGSHNRNHA